MQTIGHRYNLWIMRPLDADIDLETRTEIADSAEPHDPDLDAWIARWLGGTLSDAEAALSDKLPDGWYARIESA